MDCGPRRCSVAALAVVACGGEHNGQEWPEGATADESQLADQGQAIGGAEDTSAGALEDDQTSAAGNETAEESMIEEELPRDAFFELEEGAEVFDAEGELAGDVEGIALKKAEAPLCRTYTMSGACLTAADWKRRAYDSCRSRKMTLEAYTLGGQCSVSRYRAIKYLCCL